MKQPLQHYTWYVQYSAYAHKETQRTENYLDLIKLVIIFFYLFILFLKTLFLIYALIQCSYNTLISECVHIILDIQSYPLLPHTPCHTG